MEKPNNIKSGQFIKYGELMYLFLGYCDYKRKLCLIADRHGNKTEVFANLVSIY